MSKRTQLAGGIVHGGKGTGERPVTAQNCAATAGAAIGVLLTPAGELWMAKCRQKFRSRGHILAEAASLTSGLSQDDVVERLLDSEELQPMVARVLDAALRTNSTDTLRLVGRRTRRVGVRPSQEDRRRSDACRRHHRVGAWPPASPRAVRGTRRSIQSECQLGRRNHYSRQRRQHVRGSQPSRDWRTPVERPHSNHRAVRRQWPGDHRIWPSPAWRAAALSCFAFTSPTSRSS